MDYLFTLPSNPPFKSIDSKHSKNLFDYDKRHGWREPVNYFNQLPAELFASLSNGNLDILKEESVEVDALGMNQSLTSIIRELFDQSLNLDSHVRALVIDIKPERIIYLDDNFSVQSLS